LYEIRVYLIKDSRPGSSPLEASASEEQALPAIWTPEPQCAKKTYLFPGSTHNVLISRIFFIILHKTEERLIF